MKLLVFDVETAPNLMHVWDLFQKGPLSHQMVVSAKEVISFAAKWADPKMDGKHMYASNFHNGHDVMVNLALSLLDEADAVVHYNGKRFDVPLLNTEFLLAGLSPPSPYRQIDLYSTVKSKFGFPSNKLDYVSQAMGLGAKVKHAGYDLWRKCLDGQETAWDQMREYNIGDVDLTEKLYYKLLPWIDKHPTAIFADAELRCTNCHKMGTLQARGWASTLHRKYRRYQCMVGNGGCGKWMRAVKSEPGSMLVAGEQS